MNIILKEREEFVKIADSLRKLNNSSQELIFPDDFKKIINEGKNSLMKKNTMKEYFSEKVTKILSYAFYNAEIESIDCPNVEIIEENAFANGKLKKAHFNGAKEIKDYAFTNNSLLTDLSLESVEKIGWSSFFKTTGISQINFPKLQSLGGSNFRDNLNITEINLPELITIDGTAYYDRDFYNCTNLRTIYAPKLEKIGNEAFANCSSIFELDLPNVDYLGQDAFYNCSSLTKANLPKVAYLGDCWDLAGKGTKTNWFCFDACRELTTIYAPNVDTMGSHVFRHCNKLESVDFPKLRGTPGFQSFQNCHSLAYVNFPLVTTLPYLMITNNYVMTEIYLPKVETVSGNGLNSMYALEKITLDSVTEFAANSFNNCPKLETLIIKQANSVATMANTNVFTSCGITTSKGSIYVPDALVEDYKTATNWSVYATQIKPLSEYVLCTNITLEANELTISDGQSRILNVILAPENTVEKVKWSSSDMSVAYVLSDGTVVPKKNGTTIITAKCGEVETNCTVVVSNITEFSLENTIYQINGLNLTGEEFQETEIQLANEDKDFTIFGDVTVNSGNGQYKTIFHNLHEASPNPGFLMDVDTSDKIRFVTYKTNKTLSVPNKTQVSNFKFVITHVAGSNTATIKHLYNGTITTQTNNYTWEPINEKLYLGCNVSTLGDKRRFLKGAIHHFAVLNSVATEEMINSYLV